MLIKIYGFKKFWSFTECTTTTSCAKKLRARSQCTYPRDVQPDLWLMSPGRPLLKLTGAVPNRIAEEMERTVCTLLKKAS